MARKRIETSSRSATVTTLNSTPTASSDVTPTAASDAISTTSSDAIPTPSPRINSDEFTILSQYEKNFNQARSDYLRGIYSRDIETVKPIYERIGYKLSNPNCGGCVLNMFKQLSKEYEIYKEVNG